MLILSFLRLELHSFPSRFFPSQNDLKFSFLVATKYTKLSSSPRIVFFYDSSNPDRSNVLKGRLM